MISGKVNLHELIEAYSRLANSLEQTTLRPNDKEENVYDIIRQHIKFYRLAINRLSDIGNKINHVIIDADNPETLDLSIVNCDLEIRAIHAILRYIAERGDRYPNLSLQVVPLINEIDTLMICYNLKPI